MITLDQMIEEGHAAPIAETELATIMAKDWCDQWGGWPTDIYQQIGQIYAHRYPAKNLLKAIMSVSKTERMALARLIAGERKIYGDPP